MDVPFRFKVVHHLGNLSNLNLDRLNLREGENVALAINCVNTLHGVSPIGLNGSSEVGEEDEGAFLKLFHKSLRFFSAYFESLDENLPQTSNEPAEFNEDMNDDARVLLRRYKEGWSMRVAGNAGGIFMAWKEQQVVWASVWKPKHRRRSSS
ncbi:hypothetical protein Cni_G12879 [Canna indica]|uniref:Uncharacterized protein n=1 Tax=Canna indica TaxID=4628 RepID=A0AAQ3K8M3_9LILI|nr:hypothetical protein Cni_G12879 [Canna indica]